MYLPQSELEAEIINELFEMKDEKFAAFQSRIISNIDPDRIIGIKTPQLRKYAKQLISDGRAEKLFGALGYPVYYFELMQLRGMYISSIKDTDKAFELAEPFIDNMDNWAVCDMFMPKAFKKDIKRLEKCSLDWIGSDKTYTVRYGIVMLMKYFIKENFDEKYLLAVSKIESDEYYINMAAAWFFAEAITFRYNETIKYFERGLLSDNVHNKAIQKACESRRMSDTQKEYLKTLKRS